MPDEGRAREALARADRAKRLLEDELLKEAFDAVDASLRRAWAATGVDQAAEREKLWLMLKLAERVRAHLEAVMQGGKLAQARLTEIERKRTATEAVKRTLGIA